MKKMITGVQAALLLLLASFLSSYSVGAQTVISDKWQDDIPLQALFLKEDARVLIIAEQYSEAIAKLNESLAIKPDYYLAAYNRAVAYGLRADRQDNPADAEKDFRQGEEMLKAASAIAGSHGFEDADLYYARAWFTLRGVLFLPRENAKPWEDRLNEVGLLANKALQINPNHVGALIALGGLAELKGDLDKALSYFSQASMLGDPKGTERLNALKQFMDKGD